jgi:hypothetical protein
MELWRDPSCAASLTAAAQAGGPEGGLFADFVGAVLNDLMYLLKDSLQASRACSALLLVLLMTAAVTLHAHACAFHASDFELANPPLLPPSPRCCIPFCLPAALGGHPRPGGQQGRQGAVGAGAAAGARGEAGGWVPQLGPACRPGACRGSVCARWAFQACCNLPPSELQAHVSPLPCPAAALLPCRRPACRLSTRASRARHAASCAWLSPR